MTTRILVLGGYGVFGGYLSEALAVDPDYEVLVAGRSLEKAQAFCKAHGGAAVVLDRKSADLSAQLFALKPDIVVDAAGPFQAYDGDPYGLARAAIRAGAHYIDLSDDAQFTAGISTLDDLAKQRGVAVVSGASSVPGISSAAVTDLSADLAEVIRIDSTILPGNRAPRGLSVIRAILAQAGQKIVVQAGNCTSTRLGWSDPRLVEVSPEGQPPLGRRWANHIGAPDLALFPRYFRAKTVYFRAGLELRVLHFGLGALSFLVRWRLVRSLEPLAKSVRWIAGLFERFGSDRGAMIVRVLGRHADGTYLERSWTLIAVQGDGPRIPTFAAQILCRNAALGQLTPGAKPCLGLFSLADVSETAAPLAIVFQTSERRVRSVFGDALGACYTVLPKPIQEFHDNLDVATWSGVASVQVGTSRLAGIVRNIIGFPGSGRKIPVSITIERDGDRELWTRTFAEKSFRSVLKRWGDAGGGQVTERFGPFVFVIALDASNSALRYPVERGWFLGIPLPKWLLPVSNTTESAVDGIFTFDVSIILPLLGLMVRYAGQLTPDDVAPN